MQQFNRPHLKTRHNRLQRLFLQLMLVASVLLTACGQKGELFLPSPEAQPSDTPVEDDTNT